MTKEEIIRTVMKSEDDYRYDNVETCMDIFAKQEAIEFAEFIWGVFDISGTPQNMQCHDPDRVGQESQTTEEIYSQFIQSKETNNERNS